MWMACKENKLLGKALFGSTIARLEPQAILAKTKDAELKILPCSQQG